MKIVVLVAAAGNVDLIQTIKGLECYIRELKLNSEGQYVPT